MSWLYQKLIVLYETGEIFFGEGVWVIVVRKNRMRKLNIMDAVVM